MQLLTPVTSTSGRARRFTGSTFALGACLLVGAAVVAPTTASASVRTASVSATTAPTASLTTEPGWMDVRVLTELPEPPSPKAAAPTAQPQPTAAPAAQRAKVVYLTFDDGPDPQFTPPVLSILAAHDAHATFFLIGGNAAANPGLVKDIRSANNAIGSHTWSHPSLPRLSNAAIRDQFYKTAKVIGPTTCMRPPYGSTNPRVRQVAKGLGLSQMLWTVDTRDWSGRAAHVVEREVLDHVENQSIVLLHDGGGDRTKTVAAVKVIVPALAKAGWQMKVLPQCAVKGS